MNELFFTDDGLYPLYQKVLNGDRLTLQDGLHLYDSFDILGIGRLADYVRRKKNGSGRFKEYSGIQIDS